jgi:hypothetical protein
VSPEGFLRVLRDDTILFARKPDSLWKKFIALSFRVKREISLRFKRKKNEIPRQRSVPRNDGALSFSAAC